MNNFKLSNGLRVCIMPSAEDQSVSVEICGLAGSGYEGKKAGAAHFLEHLLFDGTKNYPEITQFDSIIRDRGSRGNGMTNKDYARYFVKSLPDEIESSFIYLSEMLINPLLRDHDFEREKTIIEQEINRFKDDPSLYLPRKIFAQLYPSSPLGRFTTGDVNDVRRLQAQQLREFWQEYYVASNFVLVVSGNVDVDQVQALAEKYFSAMPPGTPQKLLNAIINQERSVVIEQRTSIKQCHLFISYPGFTVDNDKKYSAQVMMRILTRGFSSRLYTRLRIQEAMIYSLRGFYTSAGFGGMTSITTAVDNGRLSKALKIIKEEVEKISDEYVSDEELDRGIRIASSDELFNYELNEMRTGAYAFDLLSLGKIIEPLQTKKQFESITKKEIQEVGAEIFSQPPKILILTSEGNLEVSY